MEQVTPRHFWRKAIEKYPKPLRYYTQFLAIQRKHFMGNLTNLDDGACIFLLTSSQRKILAELQKLIEESKCKQVMGRLEGGAGCGKTFLLQCFARCIVNSGLSYKAVTVTGRAANSLHIDTFYRCFGIYNFTQSPLGMVNSPIAPSIRKAFRDRDLKWLLIEETSLCGGRMLNVISERLKKIRKKNTPFGNLSVLFITDFQQLNCVQDVVLTKQLDTIKDSWSRTGCELFQSVKNIFTLTESVRQNKDGRFAIMLQRMRDRQLTSEDIHLLGTRLEQNLDSKVRQSFESALHLFSTNRQVDAFNEFTIINREKPAKRASAVMTPFTCNFCLMDYRPLYLSLGGDYMITKNIAYKLGCTNGSICKVVDVVYENERTKLPAFVVVELNDFHGCQLEGTKNHIPISTEKDNIFCNHHAMKAVVEFVPLLPYYATSFYKVQGLTLPQVCISMDGMTKWDKKAYVGISRVRKLSDVMIQSQRSLQDYFPLA